MEAAGVDPDQITTQLLLQIERKTGHAPRSPILAPLTSHLSKRLASRLQRQATSSRLRRTWLPQVHQFIHVEIQVSAIVSPVLADSALAFGRAFADLWERITAMLIVFFLSPGCEDDALRHASSPNGQRNEPSLKAGPIHAQ